MLVLLKQKLNSLILLPSQWGSLILFLEKAYLYCFQLSCVLHSIMGIEWLQVFSVSLILSLPKDSKVDFLK